jgi:hypothetical protein
MGTSPMKMAMSKPRMTAANENTSVVLAGTRIFLSENVRLYIVIVML